MNNETLILIIPENDVKMQRLFSKFGSINKVKVVGTFNHNNNSSSKLFKTQNQQQSISINNYSQIQRSSIQSKIQTRNFAETPVKVAAESIKKLRERTSAGYLDCKKALEASNNDQEKAIEWLKAKGKLSFKK